MSVSAITSFQPAQAPAINQNQKTKTKHSYFNPANVTGYGATLCGIGSIAAIQKKGKKSLKLHKDLGYAMGVLTLAHIGVVEWFRHKKKQSVNKISQEQ